MYEKLASYNMLQLHFYLILVGEWVGGQIGGW